MDWLQFIAEIVGALAWPVAAVVIAVLFHEQLQSLISRVRKGKFGPAEFEFEQDLQAVVEQSPPSASFGTATVTSVPSNPRAAILESWLTIESEAHRLASKNNQSVPRNPVATIRQLEKGKLLTGEDIALLNDLRALRNQAAHDQEFYPSQNSVRQYVQLAQGLASRISDAADQR